MAKINSTTPSKSRKTVRKEVVAAPAAMSTSTIVAIILALLLTAVLCSVGTWFFLSLTGYSYTPAAATTETSPCLERCPVTEDAPETDWLIFGRNDENGKYYMGIAGINPDLIREGTPLQQYHRQITDKDYVGIDLPEEIEDLNDSLKYVLVGNKAFKVPEKGEVAIDSVSWIRYVEGKGVLICRDDTGSAGTWYGNCDGAEYWITDWVLVEDLMASGEFQPWAAPFTNVSESFDGTLFNDKIELFVTYR